jgi:predicted MFS family arabinose efflux permease
VLPQLSNDPSNALGHVVSELAQLARQHAAVGSTRRWRERASLHRRCFGSRPSPHGNIRRAPDIWAARTPKASPQNQISASLALETPVLQRRAFYHAALFAAFSLFWTTVPLLLSGPAYGLSQVGIAWFALVGAAGVVAAPITGSVPDRGWTRTATGLALLLVALSFPLTWLGQSGSTEGLLLLAAAGILLGVGVTANVVLGQRAIFLLAAEHRARLNDLFMAAFYLSGAAGSAVGGWAYAEGGWPLASVIGLALPLIALVGFATEFRGRRPNHARRATAPEPSHKAH